MHLDLGSLAALVSPATDFVLGQSALTPIITKILTYGKLIAVGSLAYKVYEELMGSGSLADKIKSSLPYIVAMGAVMGLTLTADGTGGIGDIVGGWNF